MWLWLWDEATSQLLTLSVVLVPNRESGDLEGCGSDGMADGRAPEPAVGHRIVRRRLVFTMTRTSTTKIHAVI